jgi:uncharacterized coiled-coil DUF342 family protein
MPKRQIKSALESLHEELGSATENPASIAEIREKIGSMIAVVEDESNESLMERVAQIQETVSEVEVSHPKITATINQVMHLLSSMGI